MPISAQCPRCKTNLKVPDALGGKKVRCIKCGNTFAVGGGNSSTSVKTNPTAVRAAAPKPAPVKKSALPKIALVVGALGLLFFCGLVPIGAGVGWWFLRPKPEIAVTSVAPAPILPVTEVPVTEPPAKEPPAKETPAKEPPAKEPAAKDPSAPRGQLSAEAIKAFKGATVFIKVDAGRLSCSGSGFLVKVDGDNGFIITNHHVINPEAELLTPNRTGGVRIVKYKPSGAQIFSVFHSGTKTEISVKSEVLATDESRDLAVLRVTGVKNWPTPINLEQKAELLETKQVYILGFPFGEALAGKKGNPAITINKGSISSLRENDFGEMKSVQIDGAINPGNSGGPVVDDEGRLVGISVATIRGAGIGLAIAPDELARMFAGRVGGIEIKPSKDAASALDVRMRLIDPMGQIKSAFILYQGAATAPPPLTAGADGAFAPLPDAQRVDLALATQEATGTIKIDPKDNARVLVIQTGYVNGAGVTKYTQIIKRPLGGGDVAVKPPMPPDGKGPPAGWKEVTGGYKKSAYALWLPADAKVEDSQDSIVAPKFGQIRIYRTVCVRKDGASFIAGQIQLPPTLVRAQPKVRQDLFRDLFLEEVGGKLLEEKKANLDTMAGKEYVVQMPRGRMARYRLLGTGVQIFRVIFIGTKEQMESEDAETFFNSFRRTPAKAEAPPDAPPTAEKPQRDPTDDSKPDPTADRVAELKKFTGTWRKVDNDKFEVVFDGSKAIFVFNGNKGNEGVITIDPRLAPKTLP